MFISQKATNIRCHGRPLKNVQFCPRARKTMISTKGIYEIFRGLKFDPDAEIGQKGAFCKGLYKI